MIPYSLQGTGLSTSHPTSHWIFATARLLGQMSWHAGPLLLPPPVTLDLEDQQHNLSYRSGDQKSEPSLPRLNASGLKGCFSLETLEFLPRIWVAYSPQLLTFLPHCQSQWLTLSPSLAAVPLVLHSPTFLFSALPWGLHWPSPICAGGPPPSWLPDQHPHPTCSPNSAFPSNLRESQALWGWGIDTVGGSLFWVPQQRGKVSPKRDHNYL